MQYAHHLKTFNSFVTNRYIPDTMATFYISIELHHSAIPQDMTSYNENARSALTRVFATASMSSLFQRNFNTNK